jgi:hypothetical protein
MCDEQEMFHQVLRTIPQTLQIWSSRAATAQLSISNNFINDYVIRSQSSIA